jgi:hypothetical protein
LFFSIEVGAENKNDENRDTGIQRIAREKHDLAEFYLTIPLEERKEIRTGIVQVEEVTHWKDEEDQKIKYTIAFDRDRDFFMIEHKNKIRAVYAKNNEYCYHYVDKLITLEKPDESIATLQLGIFLFDPLCEGLPLSNVVKRYQLFDDKLKKLHEMYQNMPITNFTEKENTSKEITFETYNSGKDQYPRTRYLIILKQLEETYVPAKSLSFVVRSPSLIKDHQCNEMIYTKYLLDGKNIHLPEKSINYFTLSRDKWEQTRTYTWQSLNEPLDKDLFKIEGIIDVPDNTPVVDNRLGSPILIGYLYDHQLHSERKHQIVPLQEIKNNAKRFWFVLINTILIFSIILLKIYRRLIARQFQ